MLYWIWLSRMQGYGPRAQRELLKEYGNPKNVFLELRETLGSKVVNTYDAEKILSDCEKNKIGIRLYKKYAIPDNPALPILLYYKGTWLKKSENIAIVGSRRCTEYGKKMASEITTEYCNRGAAIISGLAKGIDSYAHSAAVLSNGYTVAVLGNGPDICYPAEHRSLMNAIASTGLIISEYPPGTKPTNYTFPARNRIIAAFADKVIVPEACKESGALITVKHAISYNKPVYALPGRVDYPESEGTNAIIQSGEAKLWTKDMLNDDNVQLTIPGIDMSQKPNKKNNTLIHATPFKDTDTSFKSSEITHTTKHQNILTILKSHDGRMSVTELQTVLKITNTALMALVTELELNDLVYVQEDNIWLQ